MEKVLIILVILAVLTYTHVYMFNLGINKSKKSNLENQINEIFNNLVKFKDYINFISRIENVINYSIEFKYENGNIDLYEIKINMITNYISIYMNDVLIVDNKKSKNLNRDCELSNFLYTKYRNDIENVIVSNNNIKSKNILFKEYDNMSDEEIINKILDKISTYGYDKLTDVEKELLNKYK